MLVSAKHMETLPLPKRLAEDATATAAAGLQGGLHGAMLQALQNQVQTQSTEATAKVQDSATQIATQQVSAASRISDNVDEAFAKTRVNLQSTDATGGTGKSRHRRVQGLHEQDAGTTAARQYPARTMGLTEDDIKACRRRNNWRSAKRSPSACRTRCKLAQSEKENVNDIKDSDKLADKFLAAL